MAGPSTEAKAAMTREEFSDMIRCMASYNEKLFKMEKTMNELAKFPDRDPYKKSMKELIEFIDQDKSTPREKAIYLYQQLAQQCYDGQDYCRAAKAYERAATLRFDISGNYDVTDPNVIEDIQMTIQYLEGAINSYTAMGKFKNVGTLHYRCSRMLRLIGAPQDLVLRHCKRALDSFTANASRDLSKLPPLSALKCDQLKEWRDQKDRQQQQQRQPQEELFRHAIQAPQYSSSASSSSYNLDEFTQEKFDRLNVNENQRSLVVSKAPENNILIAKPGPSSLECAKSPESQTGLKLTKSVEEKVESARKLVKKLRRFYPHYEVTTEGPEAGRIWCKICERHLGAVSSTLKNHVNTQEHKEAIEEINLRSKAQRETLNSNPQQEERSEPTTATAQLHAQLGQPFDFDTIDLSWLQPQQVDGIPMIVDSLTNTPIPVSPATNQIVYSPSTQLKSL